MTVHVTLLPATLPVGYEDADRVTPYEDTASGEARYSLHPSGSLIVWRCSAGETEPSDVVEVIYGPSAWESVDGDLYLSVI